MKALTYHLILSKLFLACCGLVMATGILLISLFMAHSVQSSGEMPVSSKALYFSGDVLPDNSIYPVVAGIDRLRLWVSSDDELDGLKIDYAHRRLWYAVQLLNKGQEQLAISTITKSQKYILEVAHSYLTGDSSFSRDDVIYALENHQKDLHLIINSYELTQESSISLLIEEEEAVLMTVRASK